MTVLKLGVNNICT